MKNFFVGLIVGLSLSPSLLLAAPVKKAVTQYELD